MNGRIGDLVLTNIMNVSLPDDLYHHLLDIQVFKQKQGLSSISISDIIVKMLKDTIGHSFHYQSIILGYLSPEKEKVPVARAT